MFKRRKGGTDDTGAEPVSDETVTEAVSDPAPAPASASGEGPFDISAAPDDEITRVDLGVCRSRS